MGVYIRDMEKPKRCSECLLADRYIDISYQKVYYCMATDKECVNGSEKRADDCPLIDIVTCGECKHYKREYCRLDPFWEKDTEPNDFCSRGERRADE